MSEAATALMGTSEEASTIPVKQIDERRRHPRYPFSATVEATEPKSRAKVQGRTADLAKGGCYVDTISPFPVETIVKLRLINESQACETQARVVYSLPGMGMGMSFLVGPQGQPAIISKWIGELSGELQPEEEESAEVAPMAADKRSSNNPYYVLNELIIELMRQGVLSDARGKDMLQKLLQ